MVDHERQRIRIENAKHYALKIENVKQNKWIKTGVNVCNRAVRNLANEIGFT